MAVEAELKRENPVGALVPWKLVTDASAPDALADPVVDHAARTSLVSILATLGDILTELQGSLAAVVSGTVAVSNLPATQPVSGTVAVSNFPATQPVSGAVSVSNLPATQPVSGTVSVSNFPATQPVSGSVAVSNFPASVAVSNFPATQPVSGSVAVSNLPATQPVSGSVSVSNFPATQPVSGPLTDAQIRLTPISTFGPPIQVSSSSVAAIVTDQTIVAPTATKAIRFLKLHLHMDPAAATGSYNTVTVKVGALTLFVDKFEPGLPYMESLLIASPVVDAPLTITTTSADRIFYNVRYQETT